VRAGADSAGFADISLAVGPAGNVVVLWQEMTEAGSDAHYRVYDPVSATWGEDTLLSNDSELERSFAPVWDAVGNLVLAYDNVAITKEEKSVEVAGGQTVTVSNVPQPGRVDLHVVRRALVKDLALDGLSAEGGRDFLPGEEITLKATLRNSGNVAVQDVEVSFYDGDPDNGGTPIASVVHPGWLRAAETAEVSAAWTIPAPVRTRTVVAVADRAGAVTENDEENNAATLVLGGVDLELRYLSGEVRPDGSVSVVAEVRNAGTAASPACSLELWPQDNPGAEPLASAAVSGLEPGQALELPLDLPAGAQPEGTTGYRLAVDDAGLTEDVDPQNNASLFALILWIDSDRDGLPAGWEAANGLSDSDPGDARLDADGDGFDAMREYLAGTAPHDANSYLRFSEYGLREIPGAGAGFLVSWASLPGRLYNVERSYDLKHWAVVARNVEADPPLNSVADPSPAPFGKAFYRIAVLEEADENE
jgi:hypothetical protein